MIDLTCTIKLNETMRKLVTIISLLVIFASCKKDSPIIEVEPVPVHKPDIVELSAYGGRISFEVDGTLYKNYDDDARNSQLLKGIGNRGANLKETTKKTKWTVMSGGKYWGGNPDSLQYFKFIKSSMNIFESSIEIAFIKKYAIKDMQKGALYFPKNDFEIFDTTDPKFALDFGRENDQEGVALTVTLPKGKTLRSYSPLEISVKSSLTPESHRNSTFKIIKAERIKNSKVFLIEVSFEADLFDENEQPVRVTKGSALFQLSENDGFLF